jgi:hypothetical protein
VEAVGKKRRMLREALAHAVPTIEADRLVLEVSGSEVHLQGLENGRPVVESAVKDVLGLSLQVVVQPGASGPADAPPEGPRRLNRDLEREERLKRYRANDPALDAAAEALDLELLE